MSILYLTCAAGRDPLDRDRLLHVVVVGGGPTGVEFAGELSGARASLPVDDTRGSRPALTGTAHLQHTCVLLWRC